MTEIESNPPKGSAINRRRVVVGAAWAVPVVATALAAPAAAASMANPSLAVTDRNTSLLTLQLLDGGGTLTAQTLVTVPTELTLANGSNASIVNETVTVTVTVDRPGGINISTGAARGFGVASFNGVPSTAGQRTVEYRRAPITGRQVGFPTTTYTATHVLNAPQGGSAVLPIEFGLAGSSGLLSISALASFPVTVTLNFANGTTATASSTISVPVGAGIL